MAGEAEPRIEGRVERETVGPGVVLPRMEEVDERVGSVEGELGEARIGRDGPAAGNLRSGGSTSKRSIACTSTWLELCDAT